MLKRRFGVELEFNSMDNKLPEGDFLPSGMLDIAEILKNELNDELLYLVLFDISRTYLLFFLNYIVMFLTTIY